MDVQQWQDANNRYLTASLKWLRLRLERLWQAEHAGSDDGAALVHDVAQTHPHESDKGSLLRQWFGAASSPMNGKLPPVGTAPPLLATRDLAAELEAAAEARAAAARIKPAPALSMLARQLDLSDFEADTLLLCAGMELDTRVAALCARAQSDAQRPYPTFALALSLFDEPSWDALSPQRPLRYWRLLEINQPGATPLTASPLRADERVVSYLKGLNTLDDRLLQWLMPALSTEQDIAPSQQAIAERVVQQLVHSASSSALPVVQLLGVDGASKRLVANQIALTLHRDMFGLNQDVLPVALSDLESMSRLWQRESLLLPLALYLDAQTTELTPETALRLDRFLQRTMQASGNTVVLLGVREALPQLSTPTLIVDVDKPTASEQRAAWAVALGQSNLAATQELASQFNLNLSEIDGVARGAAAGATETLRERLWRACGDITRPHLDTLAQRLNPKATWDDLVLGDETSHLLRLITDQVRHRSQVYDDWGFGAKMNRGLGISALFAGESGTGKTMAAEVIANDLQMSLYRIDLSAVVSKYIGETEKNLRRVFDAAEVGGAILFFDEADALFGKRSEVKDSHDRYANIEINYLLQRMEAYRGLAILATNMKSALDAAFMRRLRFIVTFAFPGLAERKRMWQKAFPAQMPADVLDFDKLSRLTVSGGNIHSIALNAAFLAAGASEQMSMSHVLAAARTELRKLDKPVNV